MDQSFFSDSIPGTSVPYFQRSAVMWDQAKDVAVVGEPEALPEDVRIDLEKRPVASMMDTLLRNFLNADYLELRGTQH